MYCGEKCLFDLLSFIFSVGEIFGISGDSGCGKFIFVDLLFGLFKFS